MKVQYFLILMSFIVLSCHTNHTESQRSTIEKLEIFSAKGDSLSFKKDALVFVEITVSEGDRKLYTTYKNPNNTIKGKEIYKYVKEDTNPTGVEYVDSNNVLLSYYKFVFDNKGAKISSTAFDAKTDEVLRIEKFDYDSENNLTQKDIYDNENKLNRSYIFKNDTNGNLTQMTILNEKNEVLAVENYKISKHDAKNKWIEKWGFIYGRPKTFHVRSYE
ncbi:MAG: hypothetical protein IPO92_24250 [Saprospiraceae bacterium]|nr:hypothetical protein [Saprospiraceae bacterium]